MAEPPPGDDDLTPDEMLERVVCDVATERVKGMLMFLYGLEADAAFDLVHWRSQAVGVDIHLFTHQLLMDLTQAAVSNETDLRSVCNRLLRTVHERINAEPDATPAS